tara:strand:+ start:24264 stop:24707 length:444 start_codon:yes stop_codon:yes gene_type:complete
MGHTITVAYEDTIMVDFQWETYTPYSIGFNETFSRLEALAGGGKNYPPYNIVNGPDGRTSLEIALAGFSAGDIEVETERNVLTVSARKSPEEKERDYTHRGISYKTFSRNWQMSDDVEIEDVSYVDGLLTIVLRKELPEHQKRKKWF